MGVDEDIEILLLKSGDSAYAASISQEGADAVV